MLQKHRKYQHLFFWRHKNGAKYKVFGWICHKIINQERQRHLRLWHLVTLVRADPAAERREYRSWKCWNHGRITLPETDSSHLKMDDWNTSFLLGWPIFRCYVNFREGIFEVFILSTFSVFSLNISWTHTPPKTNMDTQNAGLEMVAPCKDGHFWYLS